MSTETRIFCLQLTPSYALVLEDWAIWCRWDAAHKRGEATLASRDVDFRFTLNSGSYRRRNEPTRSGQ